MHWREVEMAVQSVVDHYAGNARTDKVLKRGIERLEDIRKNASFKAANPHELLRCLEVQSVMDNAEMVMHASRERRESRPAPFGFFRTDYPQQDDAKWLTFLALVRSGDKFEFTKVPIKP
jgi:succinate dehydrogenase/fumarate reductase flavoprotein subunit